MNVIHTVIVAAFTAIACAPQPKFQACHDDNDCKESVGKSAYCIRSRCVECVSSASCPGNQECIAVECKLPGASHEHAARQRFNPVPANSIRFDMADGSNLQCHSEALQAPS